MSKPVSPYIDFDTDLLGDLECLGVTLGNDPLVGDLAFLSLRPANRTPCA